jgi:hypothetical protein
LPLCWSIDVQPKRGGNKTHNVVFNLLDIAGSRFSIKLPTAQARLDGIEPSYTNKAKEINSLGFINDSNNIAELQKIFNTSA